MNRVQRRAQLPAETVDDRVGERYRAAFNGMSLLGLGRVKTLLHGATGAVELRLPPSDRFGQSLRPLDQNSS